MLDDAAQAARITHAEGFEQGRAEGYSQGLADGRAKATVAVAPQNVTVTQPPPSDGGSDYSARGRRIRQARLARDLSQVELGEIAKVAAQMVSAAENGRLSKSGGPAAGRPAYAKLEAALGLNVIDDAKQGRARLGFGTSPGRAARPFQGLDAAGHRRPPRGRAPDYRQLACRIRHWHQSGKDDPERLPARNSKPSPRRSTRRRAPRWRRCCAKSYARRAGCRAISAVGAFWARACARLPAGAAGRSACPC